MTSLLTIFFFSGSSTITGTSSSTSFSLSFLIIINFFSIFTLGSLPYLIDFNINSSPGKSSSTSVSLPSFGMVLILIIFDWGFLYGPYLAVLYTTFLPGSSSVSISFPFFTTIFFLINFDSGLSSYLVGSNINSSLGTCSSISCSLPYLIIFLFLITLDVGFLFVPALKTLYTISSISSAGSGFTNLVSSSGTSSSGTSFFPSLVTFFFFSGFSTTIGTSSSTSFSLSFLIIINFFNILTLGSLPYLIDFNINSSPGKSSSTSVSLPSFGMVLILIIFDWGFLYGPYLAVLYTTFLPGSSSVSISFPFFTTIFFLINFDSGLSSYLVGSNINSSLGTCSSISCSLPYLIIFLFLNTLLTGFLFDPVFCILYTISSISSAGSAIAIFV